MSAKIFLKYENKWVALTPDRKKVITSAKSIRELDLKIKKMKKPEAIYHFVLPFQGSFSFDLFKEVIFAEQEKYLHLELLAQ